MKLLEFFHATITRGVSPAEPLHTTWEIILELLAGCVAVLIRYDDVVETASAPPVMFQLPDVPPVQAVERSLLLKSSVTIVQVLQHAAPGDRPMQAATKNKNIHHMIVFNPSLPVVATARPRRD